MDFDSENLRESILEASELIILEGGYVSFDLNVVATTLDIPAQTIIEVFPTKEALAEAVLERYALNDMALFQRLSRQAEIKTDDPLDQVLLFIGYFNDFLDDLEDPIPGCIFASYTYSRKHFGPETREFIDKSLDAWSKLFEDKFDALIRHRTPRIAITARELAEMITTTIEGGFIMTNAKNDPKWTQRQAQQFQKFVALVFAE
ncbi:hypothetical protein ROA7450_01412 [Roseovarius albus]|uniref:Transcriptional regulator LmrA/YxaF-like C-terminal domain-containing protein n=1 Tax=Roseovarius albus TaxID=1247867 RepID=A0A1X6YUA9_9RHOB|nr:TetR/AcrR family transcriptional regulator [Roseovarius albus]SLN31628.1 hypothetical protein ROA7450_01412 [Roseovarius albus]